MTRTRTRTITITLDEWMIERAERQLGLFLLGLPILSSGHEQGREAFQSIRRLPWTIRDTPYGTVDAWCSWNVSGGGVPPCCSKTGAPRVIPLAFYPGPDPSLELIVRLHRPSLQWW